MEAKYKRVIIKLSGEALAGEIGYGLESNTLNTLAEQIAEISALGVEVACVVGGGNIWRGIAGAKRGIDRATADYMGMLATVINALALQDVLEKHDVDTRVMSAIEMREVAEPYIKRRAIRHLEKGRVVIFAAGTGNPFFTTDTGSALRGIEVEADVMLKGTRVDGIYTADPEKDPTAKKFTEITYDEIYERGLKVMDLTATVMCKENNLPIVVFDMDTKGNLKKVIEGEPIGTLVYQK